MTAEDVDDLLMRVDAERADWISGTAPDAAAPFDQAEDMTIFGPWGGPAGRGLREIAERQVKIAARFHGGSGRFEPINVILQDDLAIVVGIERNLVAFDDQEHLVPWVLRPRQVFRPHSDLGWIRLHRHADPLIHPEELREHDRTRRACPPGSSDGMSSVMVQPATPPRPARGSARVT